MIIAKYFSNLHDDVSYSQNILSTSLKDLLERIIDDVPTKIILENWEGKNDFVFVIKNIMDYVINFTGARNVEKIYNFIEEVVSL